MATSHGTDMIAKIKLIRPSLFGVGHSTARLALASDPVLCFHGKMLGVLPVGHRPDMKQDIPANSTRQIVEAVQAEIILMTESVGAP